MSSFDAPVVLGGLDNPAGLLAGEFLPAGLGVEARITPVRGRPFYSFPEGAVVWVVCVMLEVLSSGVPSFIRKIQSMVEMDMARLVSFPDFHYGNREYGSLRHLVSLFADVHTQLWLEGENQGNRVSGNWKLAFEHGILRVVGGEDLRLPDSDGRMQRCFADLRSARINALVGYVGGIPRRRSFSVQELATTLAYHRHHHEGLLVVPPRMVGFADTLHNVRLWFLAIACELKHTQLHSRIGDVVFDEEASEEEGGNFEDEENLVPVD